MTEHYRPADIQLPEGWTWERVEAARLKWDIADNMVPTVVEAGCVAWGTINSVRIFADKSWTPESARKRVGGTFGT